MSGGLGEKKDQGCTYAAEKHLNSGCLLQPGTCSPVGISLVLTWLATSSSDRKDFVTTARRDPGLSCFSSLISLLQAHIDNWIFIAICTPGEKGTLRHPYKKVVLVFLSEISEKLKI